MAHFLIYIPRDEDFTQITERDLGRVGLSDLVGNCSTLGTAKGPDGKQGMMYGWATRAKPYPDLHFSEDEQEWFPCKQDGDLKEGRYWIGIWKNNLPTCSDLIRNYPKSGINALMGDGQHWHFPIIRELPSTAFRDDDGTWKFEVQRQYSHLWIELQEWSRIVTNNETFDFSDAIGFLLRCLRVNYRIPSDLACYLGLFTTENIALALFAVLGHDVEADR